MYAWRKHRGSAKSVGENRKRKIPVPDVIEVYEEVPVPNLSPNGVLCKMLASGGATNFSPSVDPKLIVISLSK